MQKLIADDGKVYTNGETCGKEVVLTDEANPAKWWQIDETSAPQDGGALRFSRWGIIKALEKRGLADAFDAYLDSNKAAFRRFYGPQFFRADDADFKEMLKTLQGAFSMTDADIAAILAESPYIED